MKNLLTFLFLFFCSCSLLAQVSKIKDAGPDDKRINFVFFGDGYTTAELPTFLVDANGVVSDFFLEPPFSNYTNFFNVHAVEVASMESGADHPNIEGSMSHPALVVNTAFDGTFDAGNIHRLVTVNNSKLFAAAATNYPNYDQLYAIVNSPFYGGSGGSVAVGTTNGSASDLALHEVGHSFMNLADEYYFRPQEKANQTSIDNAGSTRWNAWVGMNNIGEFAHGSEGAAATQLKPSSGTCMMQSLSQGFCSVCSEQTIETIYSKISPLETTSPATTMVDFSGTDLPFAITTIKPIPNTLTYEWELDGDPLVAGVEDVVLTAAQLTEPTHRLLVRVQDNTGLSMKNANYVFTYEWTITNSALPLEWSAFTAQAEGKINRLDWSVELIENTSHFVLERAASDQNWETIGRLPITDLTDYRYYDELPLPGTSFYRLQAVDFDGTATISPIRQVRQVNRHFFKVYPTVTTGPVMTEVYTEIAEKTDLTVISADGRVLLHQTLAGENGWGRRELDLTTLPAGTYSVRISTGGVVHNQRIVKQ